MRYIVNSRQMKAADQYTMQELKISSVELMERAAACCIEIMEKEGFGLFRPCVVCGSGNNGGDGFAIARLLAEKHYCPKVCFVGSRSHCTEETKQQMQRLEEIGIEICNEYVEDEYSIIVDAILGCQSIRKDALAEVSVESGLVREIIGKYRQVIRQMNEARAVKFAVDIPSGVSANSGSILGIAFQADITVTFQAEKLGLLLYPGQEYAGRVIVADIGICMDKLEEMTASDTPENAAHVARPGNECKMACVYEPVDYRRLLPERRPDSHKGTYGKLLIIAGSRGMSGAAFLNAWAAYMVGAGLVRVYTPEDNRMILQQQLPEAIVTTYVNYDEEELLSLLNWADAVCIGSGIGMGEVSCRIIETVTEQVKIPCLIDADGLNLLAAHWECLEISESLEILRQKQMIITPHMMEMSRLLQLPVEEIKTRRMEILEEFTQRLGWVCVLKDSRTVTAAPGKNPCINRSGNAAMAKAGSGDVLAGVISGLMVQGMDRYDAAVLGTYLHGKSGDYARKIKGNYSVLARDLVECLSDAIKELETAGGIE